MNKRWTEANLPDLESRTAIITGGNSGIGLEAAIALARKGARTIIACRDPKRAQTAVEEIRRRSGSGLVEALPLDLSRLASVDEFAKSWLASGEGIDILVNNAGVMALPKQRSEDGFEMQFATNHLGHFALTLKLIPALERTTAPRVVTVSSITHSSGVIDFNDLNRDRSYSPSDAYTGSKLANMLFAYELDRRLRAGGMRSVSIACHPGWSATQITARSMTERGNAALAKFLVWGNGLVGQPPERGAWPTLFAATEPSLHGGEYVGPLQFFGTRGHPGVARSSANSYDREKARMLWRASEQMTGVSF